MSDKLHNMDIGYMINGRQICHGCLKELGYTKNTNLWMLTVVTMLTMHINDELPSHIDNLFFSGCYYCSICRISKFDSILVFPKKCEKNIVKRVEQKLRQNSK